MLCDDEPSLHRTDHAGLEVVAGASHLFEEPGAMATVADLDSDWFTRHLAPSTTPS